MSARSTIVTINSRDNVSVQQLPVNLYSRDQKQAKEKKIRLGLEESLEQIYLSIHESRCQQLVDAMTGNELGNWLLLSFTREMNEFRFIICSSVVFKIGFSCFFCDIGIIFSAFFRRELLKARKNVNLLLYSLQYMFMILTYFSRFSTSHFYSFHKLNW